MEMEMEMEMVGAAEVGRIGQDLTPPLSPLCWALHDSFLLSHCSSCFSPLPSNPKPNPKPNPLPYCYCSPSCCSPSHPSLHLLRLSQLNNTPPFNLYFNGETADIRLALLLLLHIKPKPDCNCDCDYDRICGLMSNRRKLISDYEDPISTRIKKGARAIAIAMDSDSDSDSYLLEEAVLCVVVTNAVEVQDMVGRSVGIAVYDVCFSWINHSCSPNACYRFVPPPDTDNLTHAQHPLLIRPSSSSHQHQQVGVAVGGPRIVVRSIKQIKKGEQVTIAYTDLLQPKESRQLELWSKYRFTCCCHRCVAVPLTYVDRCLQQVSTSNGNGNDVGQAAEESLKEYVDDAIHDYLSCNDAESCCKKLENVLVNGFLFLYQQPEPEPEPVVIRLHPQHHLSLNAYTTLASAYKVRAILDLQDEKKMMNRFSAAYSLLLALLTHPLFISEPSLIASVSNFWIGAGESLLQTYHSDLNPSTNSRCSTCDCDLMDVFKGEGADQYSSHADACNLLNYCTITRNITPKVWHLLIHGNGFLETVRDPTIHFFSDNINHNQNQTLEHVFQVGVHCLLYGGILSNIYAGHDSYFSCYVRRILYANHNINL